MVANMEVAGLEKLLADNQCKGCENCTVFLDRESRLANICRLLAKSIRRASNAIASKDMEIGKAGLILEQALTRAEEIAKGV